MALCGGKSLQHNMRAVKILVMNGNLSNKDVLYVHVMISDIKKKQVIMQLLLRIMLYGINHLKAYIIEYY